MKLANKRLEYQKIDIIGLKKGTLASAFFDAVIGLHLCDVCRKLVEDDVKSVCACIGITD